MIWAEWIGVDATKPGRCAGGIIRVDAASTAARLVARIPGGDCANPPGLLAADDRGAVISTAGFGQPGDGRCIVATDSTGRITGTAPQPTTAGGSDSDTHPSAAFDGAVELLHDGRTVRTVQWQKSADGKRPGAARPFPTVTLEPLPTTSRTLADCTAALSPSD